MLLIMGMLTILPGILLMMTSFTRILVVLSILRQALGLQQSPPNQVLIGLSLFLSLFVMAPDAGAGERQGDRALFGGHDQCRTGDRDSRATKCTPS